MLIPEYGAFGTPAGSITEVTVNTELAVAEARLLHRYLVTVWGFTSHNPGFIMKLHCTVLTADLLELVKVIR